MKELIQLERRGWQALSSSRNVSAQFYRTVLREDAVMLFPGGMRLEGKENILESFSAQSWKTFEIKEPRVLAISEDVGAVVYHVTAQREDAQPYEALISSTYARSQDNWKLVVHQQTPL
ncbi:MAG: nuclear transport factor 2 family protein [Anaerolineales bacterium]|jgi:ketosteroid isomerase-like protein